MIRIRLLVMATCLASAGQLLAQEDSFESKVAPILTERCLGCHNDSESKGGFSLQTSAAILDSGFVEPGDATESALLEIITETNGQPPEMPKTGPPLSHQEVQEIREWIERGAHWPATVELNPDAPANFDWWSLEPLDRPKLPERTAAVPTAWRSNPVDAFIWKKLNDQGLAPSREADRATLIRRLTYDLTGLPPSQLETDQFVNDASPDAYEKLVERLLASPRYGEHWARHWLDVVKYADTCGYDKDKLRAHAWPYRDYVIRSFNQDKSYARFLQEQVAGDLLFPGTPDGILGLGFIAAGPWDFIGHVEVPETKVDGKVARNLDRDDMVSNTMNTFCSVTIQCARCHDHKFDPFTQEHYYGLQAVFAAVDRANRIYQPDQQAEAKRNLLNRQMVQSQEQMKDLEQQIHESAGPQLKELNKKIESASRSAKRPEFGFHSKIVSRPGEAQWVEVELPETQEIRTIILHPCHDDFAGIGAGFGFPLRFRIEVDGQSVIQQSEEDFPNPGLQPVRFSLNTRGKTVRLVATHLAERKNDYILALAEMQIEDEQQDNKARNGKVRSSGSVEAAPRWRETNLIDGIWYTGDASQLETLQKQKEELLTEQVPAKLRAEAKKTKTRIAQLERELQQLPAGQQVYAAATHFKPEGNFKATEGHPRRVQVLHRGNIEEPGEDAVPGVIPLNAEDPFQFPSEKLASEAGEGPRRAILAKWLSSEQNPLTWRSIVNRVWHYHFGRGIVDTPNDFGRMGSRPSHPELLDWLAVEFRDGGGSFKDLHRLLVTSATYRQSSDDRPACHERDAQNQLLWKMNRRRLSAEEIRDTILHVAGRLDLTMGGPGFYLFKLEKTEHSPHYEYHKFDHDDETTFRRSIYRFIVRSQPDPFMTTLDCADSSQSTPTRNETQTPLQALTMLNNGFNLVMSEDFALRLQAESDELTAQVENAVTLAYGRRATEQEQSLLSAYAREHGLENLARILFNTSEFLFID